MENRESTLIVSGQNSLIRPDGSVNPEFKAGYYRVRDGETVDYYDVDSGLFYLYLSYSQEDGHQLGVIQGDASFTRPLESFEEVFEPEPVEDGAEVRQQEVLRIMKDISEAGVLQDSIAEDLDNPVYLTEEKGLVHSTDPEEVKHKMKTAKSSAARAGVLFKKKSGKLKSIIEEQQKILQAKTHHLEVQMELASSAIYSINVYLGKSEEIVRVCDGNAAPEQEKIRIRQMILYIEEETAAADNWAEDGGMDWTDVEKFDEWLRDPDHLNQVIPDVKGLVVLKVRRKPKSQDSYRRPTEEEERCYKSAYVLIRNGEKVYRIFTTLDIGEWLYPSVDFLDQYFSKEVFDEASGEYVTKYLSPGDQDYMKAMKAAQKAQRHYYASFLLIQGLLDRTKVFEPLPSRRINVCDPTEDHVVFVRDMENCLGDGRPSYQDWLHEVNQNIDVGVRIAGLYSWYGMRSEEEEGRQRLYPKTANAPEWDQVYTVEGKKHGRFYFLYHDGRTNYRTFEKVTRRSSFVLYPEMDDFYIAFDHADLESLEYYATSRLHRHNYKSVLPMFFQVLKLRQEEEKRDEPFIQLITTQVCKTHNLDRDEAEPLVRKLAVWWKQKNKTHRSLSGDDEKALKEIVREFKKRLTLDHPKDEQKKKEFIRLVWGEKSIAAFFKGNNTYVHFEAPGKDQVYLHITTWKWKKSEWVQVSRKEWVGVTKEYQRWRFLKSSHLWKDWRVNESVETTFTDDEAQEAVQMGLRKLRSARDLPDGSWEKRDLSHCYCPEGSEVFKPFAALLTHGRKKVQLYYWSNAVEPSIEDSREVGASMGKLSYHISGLRERKIEHHSTNSISTSIEDGNSPWTRESKKDKEIKISQHFGEGVVLQVWEDNVKEAQELDKRAEAFREAINDAEAEGLDPFVSFLVRRGKEALLEIRREEFLEDYYDEDGLLWEDHLQNGKDKKARQVPFYYYNGILSPLFKRGHVSDFSGMTLEQCATQAIRLGLVKSDYLDSIEDSRDYLYEKIKDIPMVKEEEEEEEE